MECVLKRRRNAKTRTKESVTRSRKNEGDVSKVRAESEGGLARSRDGCGRKDEKASREGSVDDGTRAKEKITVSAILIIALPGYTASRGSSSQYRAAGILLFISGLPTRIIRMDI